MFYVDNLDDLQSRQANDSASIVKRAKEKIFFAFYSNCKSA